MDLHAYSFPEHRHRFACWTAARAVQRSFAKSVMICKAIDASGNLRYFVERGTVLNRDSFDEQHSVWCNRLMEDFRALDKFCSFGRAAKIVAIYLKTAVVIPDAGNNERSGVIHPPIDRILLTGLSANTKDKLFLAHPWTSFTESQYNEIKGRIKEHGLPFNWKLEVAWQVSAMDGIDE